MDAISFIVDLFLHLDEHLSEVIRNYGTLTYAFLFVVIFIETGLVVTPFLPGDSLLFAAGTFAALGDLNIVFLMVLLFAAAVLGDTVNYWIGHTVGLKIFETQNPILKKVLKKEYLEKTQNFYAKHGGKTILLARFVPIVRTFAPFVAGVGTMSYGRFIGYNVLGGFLWTFGFSLLGYFFGNIPIVKANFEFVILGIIFVSVLPMFIEYLRGRKQASPDSTPA
jgi:membrane-associated protein